MVRLQIEIAAGGALPFRQDDIAWRGSAIECRVYAEDPYQGFLPSPGRIQRLTEPQGPGIRLDSGVYRGWTVPMEYDPLLAKLAAWAPSREKAADRLIRALGEYDVGGIRTNVRFFGDVLRDAEFRAGNLHTGFLDGFFTRVREAEPPADVVAVAALAAALNVSQPSSSAASAPESNAWL